MPDSWDNSQDSAYIYEDAESAVGGQFSYAKARLLNVNQLAWLQDALVDITGQISTRPGTGQLPGNVGSGPKIYGLVYCNYPGQVYEMAFDGNNYYKFNGSGWTSLNTAILHATPSIVQGNNKIFFCDNSDIWELDGASELNRSSDGATTAPRNASILLWHTNRLVAAGASIQATSVSPVLPDAIYFSDFLDGSHWGTTKIGNSLRVGGGNGMAVTGMASWKNNMIAVFQRHASWVVTADPALAVSDMPIEQVHSSVGCVAFRTAIQVDGDIWFLSDDGVRSLIQVIGSKDNPELEAPLSYAVQDIIQRINWNAAGDACAAFWRGLFILAIPLDNSTTNNYLLIYNTITKSWNGVWSGLPINCFAVREAGGISRLMMGLATSNVVIELLDYINPENWNVATFQDYTGSDVQPYFITRAFVFGDKNSDKLGIGGEIEWNNSGGALSITPVLDEADQAPFSVSLPSGGVLLPADHSGVLLPLTFGSAGLGHKGFNLRKYGPFRQLQYKVLGTGTGRKEIRKISSAAVPLRNTVGNF